MRAVQSLFSSRFSIHVLELYIGGYDLCALHFQLGAVRNTRTTCEIGRNFAIRIVGSMIFSLFLITFFINFSTSTIKSLILNCSNNVFLFSAKSTWQKKQDDLDDYKEDSLIAMPLTCCVQFAFCQFRQTCITVR